MISFRAPRSSGIGPRANPPAMINADNLIHFQSISPGRQSLISMCACCAKEIRVSELNVTFN